MNISPQEITDILTKARALNVASLRVGGLEVRFDLGSPVVAPPAEERPMTAKEVFEWRLKGLGGSDAPGVMRTSPIEWSASTPRKIWELKTRRRMPDPPNYPMKRGIRLEPRARAKYEQITGIAMPAVRRVHPVHEFARVNADGANFEIGRGLEIKCPGRADHALAAKGEIPPKYIFQLVHTLWVLDLPVIDYFSYWSENEVRRIEFKRDKKLEKKLIPEEERLWECVVKDVPPEPPSKKQVFSMRGSR